MKFSYLKRQHMKKMELLKILIRYKITESESQHSYYKNEIQIYFLCDKIILRRIQFEKNIAKWISYLGSEVFIHKSFFTCNKVSSNKAINHSFEVKPKTWLIQKNSARVQLPFILTTTRFISLKTDQLSFDLMQVILKNLRFENELRLQGEIFFS